MSLIGSSVLLLTSGCQWRVASIRAASQSLHSNSDLTQIQVSDNYLVVTPITLGSSTPHLHLTSDTIERSYISLPKNF